MIEKIGGNNQNSEPDKSKRNFLKFAAAGGAAAAMGALGVEKAEAQEASLDAAAKEILQVVKEIPEYKSLSQSHQFFVSSCVAAFMRSAGEDGAKTPSGFEPLQNKAALDLFIVPAYRAFLMAEMDRRAQQRAGEDVPDVLKDMPKVDSTDLANMYMAMNVPKVEAIVEDIVKYADLKAPKL